MSEYVSITGELRAAMRQTVDGDTDGARLDCDAIAFEKLCGEIDAVHHNLERENESLKVELDRVLGERYEPPVAAHWDGDVLTLTIPRDPSRIHVQRSKEQPLKVYASGHELEVRVANLLALLRDEWDIDVEWDGLRRFWYVGLTPKGERRRDEREAENAKLREFSELTWRLLTINEPRWIWAREQERARELGVEVDA